MLRTGLSVYHLPDKFKGNKEEKNEWKKARRKARWWRKGVGQKRSRERESE